LSDPADPSGRAAADPAARALAQYRSHMMAREEQFRRVEEERRAALLEAQARADHSLALLRAERDLRLEAEATLAAIKASRSWRAANRIQTLLTGPRAIVRALARLFGRGS
jgi:hypothetical protein